MNTFGGFYLNCFDIFKDIKMTCKKCGGIYGFDFNFFYEPITNKLYFRYECKECKINGYKIMKRDDFI